MNEIEYAITDLEEFLKADIGQGDLHMCSVEIALAALRSEAERSRGCEYCAKSDKVYLTRDIYTVIGNEGPYISSDEGYTCAEIKYCPMCGKRLEVEP